MEIAILSDLHLGRRNFRRTIGETNMNAIEYKGYEQWDSCIDKIIEKNPDLFVISGDFFHTANPSTLSIEKARLGLSKIEEAGIKSIVVAGNHDSNLINEKNKTHPFKNLNIFKNIEFVYNEISYTEDDENFIVKIPHFNISTDEEMSNFKTLLNSVVPLLRKNQKKKKILITHGVSLSWIQRFINKDKEKMKLDSSTMIFPDDFLERFDYTIIGHIHKSFVQSKTNKNQTLSKIIVPGSTMEDNTLEISIDELSEDGSTGPLYLDTISGKIKRDYIESVKLIKRIISSKEELDKLMSNIGFHIYSIKYQGVWSDVDLSLYNKAIRNSLNFNLQLRSELKEVQHSSIQGFWNWLKETYPENLNEFLKIAKEDK